MTSQAYFEHIEAQLLKELDQAKESIVVAVAWFTNHQLLNKLCEKCARGVSVELMVLDDEINNTSTNDLTRLTTAGGKLYMIAQGDRGEVMHNKFCVIDRATVINGSYNWSYKARQNHENITVSREAHGLAEQFIKEFRRLKTNYFSEEGSSAQSADIGQVIKRLSVIKNLIELDELEDLPLQLAKLPNQELDTELSAIIHALRVGQYNTALPGIVRYIQGLNQITTYLDPEIDGLRMEARALEIQLAALDNERTELERTLHQFHIRHTQELGPLIIKILKLRVALAKSDAEKDEAEADKAGYEEGYERRKAETIHVLTIDEQEELKQLYRQASKLCHPDMVATEHKQEATKWFVALKEAYELNDRKKVLEIVNRLKQSTAFGSMIDSLTELERLRAWVYEHRRRVRNLLREILAIKNREEYRTIAAIEDWDAYFTDLHTKLTLEIELLRHAKS